MKWRARPMGAGGAAADMVALAGLPRDGSLLSAGNVTAPGSLGPEREPAHSL